MAKSKTGVRVARDIVHTIFELGLVPGDRYLSESEALIEHGVSRATYREATRFLEFQGVISTKAGPGGGAVVAKPDWRNLASTFALLLQFSGTSLLQVMAVRRMLEPTMVAESARNISLDQIVLLQTHLYTAREQVANVDDYTKAYRAFWHEVANATGSPVTAEFWKAMRAVVDSGRFVPNEVYRMHIIERLEELLDALMKHDADRASTLMAEIDDEFAERLRRDYPQRTRAAVTWSDIEKTLE